MTHRTPLVSLASGPLFMKILRTPSCGYRNPHYKPKTVWRPCQIYNGNLYTNKTASPWRWIARGPDEIDHIRWRHNERYSVSNHQPHYCLLNRSLRRRSKKTSKLCVTGLCAENSPVNSPHKGPVTRKMFPFDDVIMMYVNLVTKTLQWVFFLSCLVEYTITSSYSALSRNTTRDDDMRRVPVVPRMGSISIDTVYDMHVIRCQRLLFTSYWSSGFLS